MNTVVPFLRASGPGDVRRAMMSAASDLCYLAGYMAVDEGLDGLAQCYYLQALELAGASEDHLTFCTTCSTSIRPRIRNHDAQALHERARKTVRPELTPA